MEEKEWAINVLSKINDKYFTVCSRTGTKEPFTTDSNGRFDNRSQIGGGFYEDDSIAWWTNGFYPGILWQLYSINKENIYKKNAIKIEDRLSYCLENFFGLSHDLGFLFYPTSVYHASIDESEKSENRALHAANLLAGRFNVNGRFIRAWEDFGNVNRSGWSIIDTMMNINLLYWASNKTNDPRFSLIANAHANTVIEHAIREDGSVKHIICFDPYTGNYIKSLGGQGYKHGSSWTRGQGWAVHGFTNCYKNTGNVEYLNVAMKVAKYCLSHITDGNVIPVDFEQPSEDTFIDNSATGILSSGFLSLSQQCLNKYPELSIKLRRTAINLLKVLDEKYANYSNDVDYIVSGASSSYSERKHEYPIIYADFYYIESLMKIADISLDDKIQSNNKKE